MNQDCASQYFAIIQYRLNPTSEGLRILCAHYQPLISAQINATIPSSDIRYDLSTSCQLICFETAHRYMADYSATFGSYFKASIQNFRHSLLRKHYSKKRGAGMVCEPLEGYCLNQPQHSQVSATTKLITAELLAEVKSQLSKAELAVFECLYYDNLSTAEIAAKLNRTTTWVYNTKARLKAKVKRQLK